MQELTNVEANLILTVIEPPRLIPLGMGQFEIQCWINQSLDVEASTDLIDWSQVDTLTNLTGTLSLSDVDAGEHDCRYYRVLSK